MIPKTLREYYKLHAPIYDITRWAFLFGRNRLKELLPTLPEKPVILDLGCGTGKHIPHLLKKYPGAKIYALDQSKEMLSLIKKEAKEKVDIKNQEYQNTSFEEQQFDLILASYSLSMMSNIDEKLNFIQLHLKKGGHLLVVDFDSTPFSFFSNWMKKNHVYFDHLLFLKLKDHFFEELIITKTAYFGLYRYSSFLGRSK
ncbi:MAG: class I SAM-dependent methyltransferase [Balneola sp.]|nr:MAG: class I SAM-dependent methyltransferase [Balneola sp.]